MVHEKAGYAWLKEHFKLEQVFLDTESVILKIASINKEDAQRHHYPVSYRPKDNNTMGHLTFAMKNEALNLYCLTNLFKFADIKAEIEKALLTNPTGKYNRLIGFFYEMLSNRSLDIPELTTGNYINAIDEKTYYVTPAIREKKFRINNNFIGSGQLSMLLKRNDNLLSNEELRRLARQPLADCPVELLERATRYLISIETKSSNEIESEKISSSKQMKFMFALETINDEELTKQKLIDTLNIIKDKHYQELDYRYQQNYLGSSGYGYSTAEYIPPKPADAHHLMDEWFKIRDKVLKSDMPVIAKAAALSSCFVYIHPFMDGNGRLSRYIMQDTLYRSGITDKQTSLPLSIGILRDITKYYQILSNTSLRIMKFVKFDMHDNQSVTVVNDTADLYKHLSFDEHALYLSSVAQKVATELIPEEINKLKQFDILFKELNEHMDLPGKDLGLIATLLMNNEGKISNKKRKGVLQSVHQESLDQAEQIYADLKDDSTNNSPAYKHSY